MSIIQTYTGKAFDLEDPYRNEIDIQDIAHALSNICRFTGHSSLFYSVANHSVLVSYLAPKEIALEALLHDASEAYLGDVSSPLKRLLPRYRQLESQVSKAIYLALLGTVPDIYVRGQIKIADEWALGNEAKAFLGPCLIEEWGLIKTAEPLPVKFLDWFMHESDPLDDKFRFLTRYWELTLAKACDTVNA